MIASMTTWPPRQQSCIEAYKAIIQQQHSEPVKFILVLSKDEWTYKSSKTIVDAMHDMGVELMWDEGNRMSHKKLMPVLERYSDEDILVVDDDAEQQNGWLQAFIDDHKKHPHDIIYGVSVSKVEMVNDKISEDTVHRGLYVSPGEVTINVKPANGAAGTLYPAGTFADKRFFDRDAYMELCSTSDETWQWAWAVIEGRTHRCLSKYNFPHAINANQDCALWNTNKNRYSDYHNAIAEAYPEYKERLLLLIKNKKL